MKIKFQVGKLSPGGSFVERLLGTVETAEEAAANVNIQCPYVSYETALEQIAPVGAQKMSAFVGSCVITAVPA